MLLAYGPSDVLEIKASIITKLYCINSKKHTKIIRNKSLPNFNKRCWVGWIGWLT